MRLKRLILFVVILIGIAYAVFDLGQRGARAYERMLSQKIMNGLDVLGYSWARIKADGLRLELHGHAPDTFARDLAFESARATAPMARVSNYATATLAPPEQRDPVRVELHRDERGVTMTGQTSSRAMRDRLNGALGDLAPELNVQDLTGIQAALPRRRLDPEIQVAALAATRLPNAYVVVEPGAVMIEGQSLDDADREDLTLKLLEAAGDLVVLDLKLRIPADVIAPFAFSAYKDLGGSIRIERCAVRTKAELQLLAGKFSTAGLELREQPCKVGLGGPGGDWTGAILAGLKGLGELPAGRLDVEYRHARLIARPPTAPRIFETTAQTFQAALPDGFDGAADLQSDDVATRFGIARETFWMHIARTGEGIALAGQVPDEAARSALVTYAGVLFGGKAVTPALTVTGNAAPAQWQTVALRVLDYLSLSAIGDVQMAGYNTTLSMAVGDPVLAQEIHDDFLSLFPDYRVETQITVDMPTRMEMIPLPGPRCADRLNRVNAKAPVDFDSGSASIAKESRPVLDGLAGVLRRCQVSQIQVGGHTDAQGSEQVNLRISQARAEAVLAALIRRGVPAERLTAKGYGESTPVADNATPEGRARNRRIEFLALDDTEAASAQADGASGEDEQTE
ncbi:MAG: OmpA family protein [Pseudomonadota bacterium]